MCDVNCKVSNVRNAQCEMSTRWNKPDLQIILLVHHSTSFEDCERFHTESLAVIVVLPFHLQTCVGHVELSSMTTCAFSIPKDKSFVKT